MRGEHCKGFLGARHYDGSSPHARGTHIDSQLTHPDLRFIPACAGNTWPSASSAPSLAVHPRMRGEHTPSTVEIAMSRGSSPHARGTRCPLYALMMFYRFIPACAGNTGGGDGFHFDSPVHPRMRGEHNSDAYTEDLADGSSPHARGTPGFHILRTARERFIPACAGNTPFRSQPLRNQPVHPRMRGEHPAEREYVFSVLGSSPHARGTRRHQEWRNGFQRFIPACAGNTARSRASISSESVHPRMRGEHFSTCANCRGKGGSSPHARGTLLNHASSP